MDMLKRLLNVVTIFFVLTLVIAIFFLISQFNDQRFTSLLGVDPIFNAPAFGMFVVSMFMFIGILVFNYIVFKKITLWHR
jgi:hypothetical protein